MAYCEACKSTIMKGDWHMCRQSQIDTVDGVRRIVLYDTVCPRCNNLITRYTGMVTSRMICDNCEHVFSP